MILQINDQEIIVDTPAQLDISGAATLTVDDSVLLLKFNENLKSPVNSKSNDELREKIEALPEGFGVTECGGRNEHGKKHQVVFSKLQSKFEALPGVESMTFKQNEDSIAQRVSDTMTLRSALRAQQESGKVLVAISTSASKKDESCVAIIQFNEDDSRRNQSFFLQNTPLGRVYRHWNYYLVDNLSSMLTNLLTTYVNSFECFFNTKNEVLTPIEPTHEPVLAVTWVGRDGGTDKFSFFYPGDKIPAELQGVLAKPTSGAFLTPVVKDAPDVSVLQL